MAFREYPYPEQFRGDIVAWTTKIAALFGNLIRGRANIVGECELVADGESSSTVVEDPLCHQWSCVALAPLSEASAGVPAHIAETDYGDGQFTITHPTLAEGGTYRFRYTIQG